MGYSSLEKIPVMKRKYETWYTYHSSMALQGAVYRYVASKNLTGY